MYEHTAYIECHLAAGNVSSSARGRFLEGIRADIEADGGETTRQQQVAERHAANLAAAAAKRVAIERQALVETLHPGKGDGKGPAGRYVTRKFHSEV